MFGSPVWAAQPGAGKGPARSEALRVLVVSGQAELPSLSLARTPPPSGPDPEAVRVVLVASSPTALPTIASLASFSHDSERPKLIDSLAKLALAAEPCPAGVVGACVWSQPFRLVIDEVDRKHPLLDGRAIMAVLGGSLEISAGSVKVAWPVSSPFGRHQAKLRVRLVRLEAGGPPPIGRDAAEAKALAVQEVQRAASVFSVCGVGFGPVGELDVAVVDPPPPYLLSLGCDAPAPARGGDIGFSVESTEVKVGIPAGSSPRGAARLVAKELERLGFKAIVSDNRAPHAGSIGSSDVLVKKKGGGWATLSPRKVGPLSTDAALDACIGRVAPGDGLQHFTDSDAITGTLEERTLIKAFDDGDPRTLDVFVLPSFGGDARIGESFIFTEHGAIRNVVIEDRAGFRAQKASFTLAHEIGHVLLDQPGHPDDFDGDAPTSLMDADAVNATAFGPRRLSFAECERVHRQTGPASLSRLVVPVLEAPQKKSR